MFHPIDRMNTNRPPLWNLRDASSFSVFFSFFLLFPQKWHVSLVLPWIRLRGVQVFLNFPDNMVILVIKLSRLQGCNRVRCRDRVSNDFRADVFVIKSPTRAFILYYILAATSSAIFWSVVINRFSVSLFLLFWCSHVSRRIFSLVLFCMQKWKSAR